jgi:DNA-binding transcriptional LysR family regulator
MTWETLVRVAIDGIGLAFVSGERVELQLATGELIRVLEDWCQPFPGFFLYPSQRQLCGMIGKTPNVGHCR